jgi:hypothetical protein
MSNNSLKRHASKKKVLSKIIYMQEKCVHKFVSEFVQQPLNK